jgi:hypothetical protein
MAAMPAHPLSEVKKPVGAHLQTNADTVWFSAPSRSTERVVALYPHFNVQEAVRFVLNGIMTLTEGDYCSSNTQWDTPKLVADVYALTYDSKPWFVKFLIENGCLEEISFHPPEKTMKTISGKTIPGVKP